MLEIQRTPIYKERQSSVISHIPNDNLTKACYSKQVSSDNNTK